MDIIKEMMYHIYAVIIKVKKNGVCLGLIRIC